MTINERIRRLRKERLKMSQTEFAELIGMKQTSVSSFERIGATVTNQTITSICNAVPNLNPEWLRTGAEPMFVQPDTFSLDRFITEHGATELEREVVKTYFELPLDIRQVVMEHFRKRFLGSGEAVPAMTPIEKNTEETTEEVAERETDRKSWNEMTKDEKLAELSRQLDEEEATQGEEPQSGGGATA